MKTHHKFAGQEYRYGKLSLTTLLLVLMGFLSVAAADTYEFPANLADTRNPDSRLVIYSTTDIDAMRPLVEDFQLLRPGIHVTYEDLQSLELFARILRETDTGRSTADLAFSSAMDLQMKLANDGYAQAYKKTHFSGLPAWANWRNEAFGITFEPAVIVYNNHSSRTGKSLGRGRNCWRYWSPKTTIISVRSRPMTSSGVGSGF